MLIQITSLQLSYFIAKLMGRKIRYHLHQDKYTASFQRENNGKVENTAF